MATLNFPDPGVTTEYVAPNGVTYTWDATLSIWKGSGGGGGGGATYGAKNGVGLDTADDNFQVDMAPLVARTAV